MRVRRSLATLCAAGCLLALAPASAAATDGGAVAPDASGGVSYRQALTRLTTRRFTVSPSVRKGARAAFTYRIDGPPRSVRVRVDVLRGGKGRPALKLSFGSRLTRRTYTTRRSLA